MKSIESEKENLIKIMHGIAMQFGSDCEVVLHDFEKDHNHTITAIENGHVTSRRIGDPITSAGLEIMRGAKPAVDSFNDINQANGKILRTSSIYLHNDDGRIIGSLCINLDITNLIATRSMIDSLIYLKGMPTSEQQPSSGEIVTNDVNEMLDILIEKSISYVGVPVASMTKEEKIQGLRYLDERGAFLIKKASDRIAQSYGISRFSVYNYLDAIRNPDAESKPEHL